MLVKQLLLLSLIGLSSQLSKSGRKKAVVVEEEQELEQANGVLDSDVNHFLAINLGLGLREREA